VFVPGANAALAEACLRLSPVVALRADSSGGEAVFIEIGKSRRILSEASAAARIEALVRRLGLPAPRLAFGANAAEAWVRAKWQGPDDGVDPPVSALEDYATPFKRDADVAKKCARVAELLISLGVERVSGFVGLPRSGLVSRFGREATWIWDQVQGLVEPAWPAFRPAARIREKMEVQDPEAHGLFMNMEGCTFVLRGLVDRAMARLRGQGLRASAIDIHMSDRADARCRSSMMNPGRRRYRIELPVPQGSVAGLLPILREKLGHEIQRRPFESPIERIELEVSESVPGSGTQVDFFSKKEQEQEAWEGLLGRLASHLGKERVFMAAPAARYLPERAYLKKLVAHVVAKPVADGRLAFSKPRWADGGGVATDYPKRPSRVLARPERLEKAGRVLASSSSHWKVIDWQGPERLSGEWWDEGFERDYYQVVTERGERLWVYFDPGTQAIFLHGYFD
jgi:hypothetical protein